MCTLMKTLKQFLPFDFLKNSSLIESIKNIVANTRPTAPLCLRTPKGLIEHQSHSKPILSAVCRPKRSNQPKTNAECLYI